jgi:hypothetical protein
LHLCKVINWLSQNESAACRWFRRRMSESINCSSKKDRIKWSGTKKKFGSVSLSWNFFTVHQTHGEMALTALAHLLSKSDSWCTVGCEKLRWCTPYAAKSCGRCPPTPSSFWLINRRTNVINLNVPFFLQELISTCQFLGWWACAHVHTK